jgi:hypothetical protein
MEDLRYDAYAEVVRTMQKDTPRVRWIPVQAEEDAFVLESAETERNLLRTPR